MSAKKSSVLTAFRYTVALQGFAIGSAVVDSGLGVVKSLIMGLAYAITTPVGIAIGERARCPVSCRAGGRPAACALLPALAVRARAGTTRTSLAGPRR